MCLSFSKSQSQWLIDTKACFGWLIWTFVAIHFSYHSLNAKPRENEHSLLPISLSDFITWNSQHYPSKQNSNCTQSQTQKCFLGFFSAFLPTDPSQISSFGCCSASLCESRWINRIYPRFLWLYLRELIDFLAPFPGFAAKAGLMSGFSGLESIPGPQIPQIDFLNRFNGLMLNFPVQFRLYMKLDFLSLLFNWDALCCRRKPEEVRGKWCEIQIVSHT